MKKVLLTTFLSLFFTSVMYSQTIYGTVTNDNQMPIEFVNITINSKIDNSIIAYTYSDSSGKYSITISDNDTVFLNFYSMSYENKRIKIGPIGKGKKLSKNVILRFEAFEINTVVIRENSPITIRGDTTIFESSFFLNGSEDVVMDLLNNIPGLNVNNDGIVTYKNKEIEKIMIHGDDFFEKGYSILTKNMPSNIIEKVEVLENYSDKKLLKGIENSDKVALNLIMDDEIKRKWFSNIKLEYGISEINKYNINANVINVGTKNKFFFLTNFNDIGFDAIGNTHNLTQYSLSNISSQNFVEIESFSPNIDNELLNFNDSKLASVNMIFNPTKKIKITCSGLFFNNNKFSSENNILTYQTNKAYFSNNESRDLKKIKLIKYAKINAKFILSKSDELELSARINDEKKSDENEIKLNDKSIYEELNTINDKINIDLNYTKKIHDSKAIEVNGSYINEKSPQLFSINNSYFSNVDLEFGEKDLLEQENRNSMNYTFFSSKYLSRTTKDNLIKIEFGLYNRGDYIMNNLYLKSDGIKDTNLSMNSLKFNEMDFYSASSLNFDLFFLKVKAELQLHKLTNKLYDENSTKSQSDFLINPNIGLIWQLNDENNLLMTFSKKFKNSDITDIYSYQILTGYNSSSKGIGEFDQLESSNFLLNYTLGSLDKNQLNTSFLYIKNHNYFSNQTTFENSFYHHKKTLLENKTQYSFNSEFNRYIKLFSSNFKAIINYSHSNYLNIFNYEKREVKSNVYSLGFELRSGFLKAFNYHIGFKRIINETSLIDNLSTNSNAFVDLNFKIKKLNMQIQTERYNFEFPNGSNISHYFTHLTAKYIIKKNKLSVSLKGQNLTNTKLFNLYSVNEFSTSIKTYHLLPRIISITINYRF